MVNTMTIHLLEDGAYRTSVESRAFPGWMAEEVHAAMNETTPSARTYGILERVGTLLGAREGTGPDDDPLLRSQRRQGFEAGRAEGRATQRPRIMREVLRSQGIEVSKADLDRLPAFWESSDAAVVSAALDSESASDFVRRVQRRFLRDRS